MFRKQEKTLIIVYYRLPRRSRDRAVCRCQKYYPDHELLRHIVTQAV